MGILKKIKEFFGSNENDKTINNKTRDNSSNNKDYVFNQSKPSPDEKDHILNLLIEFENAVRISFQHLPFNEYQVPSKLFEDLKKETMNGRPSVTTLQSILIDMEHYLGMKTNKSIIIFEKIDPSRAGYIERNNYSLNEITVGYNHLYGPYNYLSVLSHELSHAYQFSLSSIPLFSGLKQELFTDFLTFYLGFGKYTKLGKHSRQERNECPAGDKIRVETKFCTLGYLDEYYFNHIEYDVNQLRQIKIKAKKLEEERIFQKKHIDDLMNTIEFYLDIVKNQLGTLKSITTLEKDFSFIQSIYLKYDNYFVVNLKKKCHNSKTNNVELNRQLISEMNDIAKNLLIETKRMESIIENYK